MDKISFKSDYQDGAHPKIMSALWETNGLKTNGYGNDPFCESAKQKIRAACQTPDADVYFPPLSGTREVTGADDF